MFFSAQTYSVLLVSSMEKMNQAITDLMSAGEYYPVTVVRRVSEAKRRLLEQQFDLVLVNAPLPDDFGLRLAIDAARTTQAGVLLLVKRELYDETDAQAVPCGVVTLAKPTSAQTMAQQLRVLCAIRERLRLAEQKQSTVEEKIEEIRLVNRAKWLLIRQRDMSEEEAHRFIEKQAMDLRLSKGEVARRLLRDAD